MPLPVSEDHQRLWRRQVAMDPDLNICVVEHTALGTAIAKPRSSMAASSPVCGSSGRRREGRSLALP